MFIRILLIALFVIAGSMALLFSDQASNSATAAARPLPTPVEMKPTRGSYRGVMIGMSMAEARAKMGEAKEQSADQDYYVYDKAQMVQVLYEKDIVKAVSATYTIASAAPTPLQVFGEDAEVAADGGVNKMVKYPKLGYWISYLRTGGADQLVMITVHKLYDTEQ